MKNLLSAHQDYFDNFDAFDDNVDDWLDEEARRSGGRRRPRYFEEDDTSDSWDGDDLDDASW